MYKPGINKTKIYILNYFKILLAIFFLSSCQSDLKNNKENIINIAVALPCNNETNTKNAIYEELKNHIHKEITGKLLIKSHIKFYDTSSYEKIKFSAQKIIESNTDLIIGPIFTQDTRMLNKLISNYQIPIITFSNNLYLSSDNIIVFGQAPYSKISSMIDYLNELGHNKFISLIELDNKTRELQNVVENCLKRNKQDLVHSSFFSKDPHSIELSIKQISNQIDMINESEDIQKKPVLFLNGKNNTNIKLINEMINSYSIDKKSIFWTNEEFIKYLGDDIDLYFTGSFSHYSLNNNYHYKHHILKDLATDIVDIISVAIGTHFNKDLFLHRINNTLNYQGLSGNIQIKNNITSRRYDIIKRHNGEFSKN